MTGPDQAADAAEAPGASEKPELDHRALFFATAEDPAALAALHRRVERLIGVPPSFASATLIVPRLARVVARARAFDPALMFEFDAIYAWIAAFQAVPPDHDFAQLEILGRASTGRRGPDPALGKRKQQYPLWRALLLEHRASDDPVAVQRGDAFLDLKVLLVCSHMRARFGLCDRDWHDRVYNIALLIRDLGVPQYLTELDHWSFPSDILGKRRFLINRYRNGPEALRHRFGLFADLILRAYCLEERRVIEPREYGERLAGTRVRRKGGGHDLIFEDFSVSVIALGRLPMPGEQKTVEAEYEGPGQKDRDDILGAGACPDEYFKPDGYTVDADDLLDEGGSTDGRLPPLASLFAAARGRFRAEMMRAQAFVTRRGRPRVVVLGRLISALEACAAKPPAPGPAAGRLRAADVGETVRLAAVCLATGSRAEAAVHLVAFERVEQLPAEWELAYSPKYAVWLRPYGPPERHPLADEVISRRISVQPRIAISDCWSVGNALGVPRDGRWFRHAPARYRATFDAVIRPFLIEHGVPPAWADLDVIAGLLVAWFDGLEEGEAMRNDAIFGLASGEAQPTRHYVALDRRQLDAYCHGVMNALWGQLKLHRLVRNGRLFSMRTQRAQIPDSLAGNDWAPKAAEVRELLVHLRGAISTGAANVFEQHNLVAAYVGAGLSLALAFRDVCTPMTDLDLIDPETGFAAVQEKDFADGAHARIVWVPPLIRTVVADYLAYLSGLWSQVLTMPTSLSVKPTKARDRRTFGSQRFDLSLRRTLFFFECIDGDWQAVEFTGARLKEHLDRLHPGWIIKNAGRHLGATNGFNSGDGRSGGYATILRALLAHWSHGQWAWAPSSGFDPYRYREAIEPAVNALIEAIDYREITF